MKNVINKMLSLLCFIVFADIAIVVAPLGSCMAFTLGQDTCSLKGYKIYRSSDIFKHTLKKEVPPKYPKIAQQAKVEGSVIVRIFINKHGKVIKSCIIEGPPLLRRAALEAARRREYKEWCTKCTSKQVGEDTVTYEFSLNNITSESKSSIKK